MPLARLLSLCLIISLLSISTPSTNLHAQPEVIATDLSNLSFSQEITIPIDTSLDLSKHQPIDIRINFEQSCWARNETIHSVRIAYSNGNDFTEIESQIYDLTYADDTHIESASIVFLIPEESTGDETYHVFYSNEETSSPDYTDHIAVEDTHYFYEPITGQIMDFDYYQIKEDENIIYGICQKGELLGNGMSNSVIKLLPESKEFASKNAEQIAGFYSSYSVDPAGEHVGSQLAKEVTKSILVDGNLMTRIRIKGISPNGVIQTDNIYSYYYSPTVTKRLVVNVNHQTLKNAEIQGTQEREGTFASLSTIKARSGTIDDMNIGNILPKIHFYSEDNTIIDYDMPTDPDVHPADWLLGYKDDQDLGEKAWLCIDDPSTGQAQGLIFEAHTGFFEGEHDGIQIKASVNQHVKLPGLEADTGDLFAFRNAYENGNHITSLKEGENILFNVQYIALQSGGYERVDQESEIFQEIIKDYPIQRGNESLTDEPTEEPERYQLKTTVRRAISAPLGSLLSAALGRNISYLTAELHKAKTLVSSGSIGRLKFNSLDIEFEEDATFIQKIKAVTSLFDFKNSTFFKTFTFNDIEAGPYLIKIYKENPARHEERQFIGYSIVDVSEDTATRINCKQQTTVEVMVTDQDDKPLKNSETLLMLDDVIITKVTTDEKGQAILAIPTYTDKDYIVRTIYDGFIVYEEEVTLNFLNRFRPWASSHSINRYDLKLNVKDKLGLVPGKDPRPIVKSQEMLTKNSISAEKIDQGTYQFIDLYSANYDITLSYKSWEHTESITLNNDETIDIIFPAEFTLEASILNQIGNPIELAYVTLEREGEKIKNELKKDGTVELIAPPGDYFLSVSVDDETIAAQKVTIDGDKSINIISNQSSLLHNVLPLILIFIGLLIAGLLFWKKNSKHGIFVLLALLLISSIVLPWWQLNGDNNSTETTSQTYLYPPTLITQTQSGNIIGGEISEVPEVFTTVLSLLSILVIVTSLLLLASPIIQLKFPKISTIVSIIIIILLILNIVLFYITMSEVTKIGIGNFFGSGEISISAPGESTELNLDATWGAGLGLYTVLVTLIGFFFFRFFPEIYKKSIKKIV